MDPSGKVQSKVIDLEISEQERPSNKQRCIGKGSNLVSSLFVSTNLVSMKQWVEPESIKVITGTGAELRRKCPYRGIEREEGNNEAARVGKRSTNNEEGEEEEREIRGTAGDESKEEEWGM